MENIRDLIHRTNTRLYSKHPFYASIACRLKIREDNNQPTMATDGTHLFANRDWFTGLTKSQQEAVIAHEAHHVFHKHTLRIIDTVDCWREHITPEGDLRAEPAPHTCSFQIAQIAADMSINPVLKDGGFDMMEDGVFPEQAHWNESFEQHYKRIRKSAKTVNVCMGGCEGGKDGKKGHKHGPCSGVRPARGKDGKELSPAERQAEDMRITQMIQSAAAIARSAGKLPADVARMLGDMQQPQISWKDVLRRFMQAISKNDYRWMPPNRRFVHEGLYLPSLRSETVGRVLLLIDGSGSTYSVFPQFIAEFASILLDVRPETLDVVVWDTRATWWKSYDNWNDESLATLASLVPEMGAGGGTVFTDCWNWYEKEFDARPEVAICLTDMELYGGFPADPGYPVMWVATTDITGPYGETVRIDDKAN